MKRIFCIFISLIILFSLPAHVQAQSKDEKVIEKQVNGFMKSVKNYNPGKIDAYFKKPQKNYYIYNPDVIKLIKKMHKDTKYEIASINASKKKAIVKIRVERYDADTITYMMFREIMQEYIRTKKINVKRMYSLLKKYYKNDTEDIYADEIEGEPYTIRDDSVVIGKKHPTVTQTVKIEMVKVQGKWKIKKMNNRLFQLLDCDILNTLYYYQNHPLDLIF